MPLECIKYEKGCTNKMFVRADLMPHHPHPRRTSARYQRRGLSGRRNLDTNRKMVLL
jgi:hypothetical protein